MEVNDKLKKIGELLGIVKTEEVQLENVEVKAEEIVAVKLEQANLDNGTVLEAEMFEAGQDVFIVSDDERVPVPVGEYKLEDGRMLVIEADGIIASIGDAPEEEAPSEEVEQSNDFVTVEDFNNAINEIKALLTSHDEEILKQHETEKAELSSQVESLKTDLSEVPASKKINSSPEVKETEVKMNIISANRRPTTGDRVTNMLNKLYKNNKNEY